jgi:hypothetical protein
MTRVMVDSTNVADDPASAQLVAYYVDGIYATTAAVVRSRFPNAVLVPISAIGTNNGIVGDQEPGCMDISQAITWVEERRAAGLDPSIYVNETYGWPGARHAFDASGVAEPHWWVADYDGIAVVPSGAVAKQYENPPMDGGHFDLSVVADYWPGVDGQFSGGSGSLGEEDLLPEERTWLQEVVVMNQNLNIALGITGSVDQSVVASPGTPSSAVLMSLKAAQAFDPKPLEDAIGAVKAELDAVRQGIAPADLTTVESTLANVQTIVTAIRATTDKDLAK